MDDTDTARLRLPLAVVGCMGLLAVSVVLIAPTLAALLVAVQLAGLVGWPLATSAGAVVRSRLNRIALAVAFSLALSMLSFQSLYWFGLASTAAVVALATVYGLVLGWLMPSGNRTYGWRAGGSL